MIEREKIEERIRQLMNERATVAARIKEIQVEQKQIRQIVSAYDGAIGELSMLLNAPTLADEQESE